MKNNNSNSMESAMKKANINIDELKQASQNGNAEEYLSQKLPKDASEKIKKILNDKEATKKLLSSPQAQKLFDQLKNK